MRFLLFDRIDDLEPGKRVAGWKCVSLAEDVFGERHPRRPLFPASLLLEALVEITAWAAIAGRDYGCSAVLAGVDGARLAADVAPGTRIRLEGELLALNAKGSVGRARAMVDGVEVATVERILYAHVPGANAETMKQRLRYLGGTP